MPTSVGPNNNNFAFIQPISDVATSKNGFELYEGQSRLQENEKQGKVKILQAYLSDYSDERIRHVLIDTNWDTDKALDILMGENYKQADTANQTQLNQTNELYAQTSTVGQELPANTYSAQYIVPKPSKRRRQQFDGQSNLSMQSANASPARNQNSFSVPR